MVKSCPCFEKCGINKAGACNFKLEAFFDQHYGLGVGSVRLAPADLGWRHLLISTMVMSNHVWYG